MRYKQMPGESNVYMLGRVEAGPGRGVNRGGPPSAPRPVDLRAERRARDRDALYRDELTGQPLSAQSKYDAALAKQKGMSPKELELSRLRTLKAQRPDLYRDAVAKLSPDQARQLEIAMSGAPGARTPTAFERLLHATGQTSKMAQEAKNMSEWGLAHPPLSPTAIRNYDLARRDALTSISRFEGLARNLPRPPLGVPGR